jgi:hypothetical protein
MRFLVLILIGYSLTANAAESAHPNRDKSPFWTMFGAYNGDAADTSDQISREGYYLSSGLGND